MNKEKLKKKIEKHFEHLWENTCQYTKSNKRRKQLIKNGIFEIIDGRTPTSRWKIYRW